MSSAVQTTVDPVERTATIATRFDHPIDAVWELWSDPGTFARWWGPPGMPMTVDHHDLRAGGHIAVTVQAGRDVIRGRLSIAAVDPPRSLRFTFASDGLDPTDVEVRMAPGSDGATSMTITARFASEADLDRALAIGFVEGVAHSCRAAHAALSQDD